MRNLIVLLSFCFMLLVYPTISIQAIENEFVCTEVTIDKVNGIKITGLTNRNQSKVTIPEQLNGKPVLVAWLEDMNIQTVDVSEAIHLRELSFHNNDLTSIYLKPLINLTKLKLSNNRLIEIDVSSLTKLEELNLMSNFIRELNVTTFTHLVNLYISNNKIADLKIGNLTSLEILMADRNELKALDVAKLVGLKVLQVNNNFLTSIDVEKLVNLTSLRINDNLISQIDESNLVNLRTLYISNTLINDISIENMPRLSSFSFYLTNLPASKKNEFLKLNILSTESVKPIIDIQRVSDSEARLTISDSHSEIRKIEYAWVKGQETPSEWEMMFDNSIVGTDKLWSIRRTTGYGAWTTGKSVILKLPENSIGEGYYLHVRATDMFNNVLVSKSGDIFIHPFPSKVFFLKDKMDSRVTVEGEFYRFIINEIQLKLNKSEVDKIAVEQSILEVAIEEKSTNIYEVQITVNDLPISLDSDVVLTFRKNDDQFIAMEETSAGRRFISQKRFLSNIDVYTKRSAVIVFTYGRPYELLDVPVNHYSERHVKSLVKYGIVNGVSTNEFAGDRIVTRAEFASLIARSLSLDTSHLEQTHFTDVEWNSWYAKDVQALFEIGLIQGTSETTFGTLYPITRQDTAVMMYRLMNYLGYTNEGIAINIRDIEDVSDYAKKAAQVMTNLAIINGYGEVGIFKPFERLTRYQMAKILDLTLIELQLKNS